MGKLSSERKGFCYRYHRSIAAATAADVMCCRGCRPLAQDTLLSGLSQGAPGWGGGGDESTSRQSRDARLAGGTAPRSDRGPSICFSFIRPNFKPMSCTRDPRLASAGQEIDAVVPLKRDTCKVWKIFIAATERGPLKRRCF